MLEEVSPSLEQKSEPRIPGARMMIRLTNPVTPGTIQRAILGSEVIFRSLFKVTWIHQELRICCYVNRISYTVIGLILRKIVNNSQQLGSKKKSEKYSPTCLDLLR